MTFRRRLRRNITGTPISIVNNVQDIWQLSAQDYVMISQPDCLADIDEGGFYKSKALSFEDFAKQISADVYKALGFGSMVNELSNDYSPAIHFHPEYSSLSVTSYCSNRREQVLCSLVTFEVDGISENVSIPTTAKPAQELAEKLQLAPKIGEMRLFGAASYALLQTVNKIDLDMDSPTFAGWAVPDGREIDPERFPGAAAIIGRRLPIAEQLFMKLNPFEENCTVGKNSNAELNQLKPVPVEQHQHSVQQGRIVYGEEGKETCDVNFSYNVHYNVAKDDSYNWKYATVDDTCGELLEYGYTPCNCAPAVVQVGVKITAKVDTSGVNVDIKPYSDEIQSYPSFTPLLSLVYIGKPYSLPSTSGIDENSDGLLADDQYAVYKP